MAWLRRWAITYRTTWKEYESISDHHHPWSQGSIFAVAATTYILKLADWPYPCHLLLVYLLANALLCTIGNFWTGHSWLCGLRTSPVAVASCVFNALSQLFEMQTILHVQNAGLSLSLILLVLAIEWPAVLFFNRKEVVTSDAIHLLAFCSCCASIWIFEYRLSPHGLLFAYNTVATSLIARFLQRQSHDDARQNVLSHACSIFAVLVGCFAFSEAHHKPMKNLTPELMGVIACGSLFFTCSMAYGRSCLISLRPPRIASQASALTNATCTMAVEVYGAVWPFLYSAVFFSWIMYLNAVQCISLLLAIVILIRNPRVMSTCNGTFPVFPTRQGTTYEDLTSTLHTHVKSLTFKSEALAFEMDQVKQELDIVEGQPKEKLGKEVALELAEQADSIEARREHLSEMIDQLSTRLEAHRTLETKLSDFEYSGLLAFWNRLALCYLVIVLLLNNFISHPRFSQGQTALNLDNVYVASNALDIVLSAYDEPQREIRQVIRSLKSIPAISSAKVHLYTKNPYLDTAFLRLATGADEVVHLRNIGREGHTYLHHITEHWNDLAAHSIFLQAAPHHLRHVLSRLDNYFDLDRTGFLHLGAVEGTCGCGTCRDRFGWSDPATVQRLYNETWPNAECNRVVLTYKGQFVASAKRIRGAGKARWQELKDTLEDKLSWIHQPDYVHDRANSMNRPQFGYTLERMWGVLMQCNSMEMAWKCPTRMSGKRIGGDSGDCQCFDEKISHDE